jgi:hypothetical protein
MTGCPPPPDRHLLGRWSLRALLLVLAGVVAGGVALFAARGRDRTPAKLDEAFVYDVERYRVIPGEMIGYRETARFATGLSKATAVAVGPDGRIAAGGDERVLVFSREGSPEATIPVPGTVFALSASPRGDLLVATSDRIGSCPWREPLAFFAAVPGDRARVTSIAADADSVYAADVGARHVWRFGFDGHPLGRIGDRDPARHVPGFSVPSPYFDLCVAPDGLLRVVDPGRHHIDAFTPAGDLEFSWGKTSYGIEGFSGCCNPSHIALLPDGSFVTSEKGIPRVKVHGADGSFVTAVVGCDGLDTRIEPCDVAADRDGRVILLDPGSATIRVFEARKEGERGD